MSDELAHGASEIESLLGERQRLQEWLGRLAEAKDAPARVKDRVRADYEGRLAEVVARLRGFSANITTSLNELRNRLREVESRRAEIEEEQAEARLRHVVGEFADQEWERIDGEAHSKLGSLGHEIGEMREEIVRLEEVLGQIVPPPPPKTSRPHEPEPIQVQAIESDPVSLQPRDPGAEPLAVPPPNQLGELADSRTRTSEAPRFTPRGTPEPKLRDRGGRLIRFPQQRAPGEAPSSVDELTFLKSVAIESPDDEAQAKAKSAGAAKTLKCTDCGAMNRPTEWYCERCGAELAAL